MSKTLSQFLEDAKEYCRLWERDLRNVKDHVKASKELFAARERLFISYRNLSSTERGANDDHATKNNV